MGLFNRKSKTPPPPADPVMAELGREYAIACRHGDRKAIRRIERQLIRTPDADMASFEQGQQAYEAIPPAYTKPRRGKRRR